MHVVVFVDLCKLLSTREGRCRFDSNVTETLSWILFTPILTLGTVSLEATSRIDTD